MHTRGCLYITYCPLLQPLSLTPVLTPVLQSQQHFIFSPDYTLTGSATAHSFSGPSAGPCLRMDTCRLSTGLSSPPTPARRGFPRFTESAQRWGKWELLHPLYNHCHLLAKWWCRGHGVSSACLSFLDLEPVLQSPGGNVHPS